MLVSSGWVYASFEFSEHQCSLSLSDNFASGKVVGVSVEKADVHILVDYRDGCIEKEQSILALVNPLNCRKFGCVCEIGLIVAGLPVIDILFVFGKNGVADFTQSQK